MAISELRVLPPLAIGRLGSSPNPLEAYELCPPGAALRPGGCREHERNAVVCEKESLEFRKIVPRETLKVDMTTGAITKVYTPENIRFRDRELIRPVCPFLEIFARTATDTLEPVTLDLLAAEGLGPQDIRWTVTVGNIKMFRRTGDESDKVIAKVADFNDHTIKELRGKCENFFEGKYLPFGHVRYIRPTKEFPGVRLRFTPAHGKVYGASMERQTSDNGKPDPDPVLSEDRVIYDPKRGKWRGYSERTIPPTGPTVTKPGAIYAGYTGDGQGEPQVSWGYLDDECDGFVIVEITFKDGRTLSAHAHISAGPPTFAPDSLPIRTVSDELEQILLGPEIEDAEVSIEEAVEIIRRALDTVRLMNTAVMNANTIDGRSNVASTMARQDTYDYGRQFAPIMAPSLVDNLAVRALHESIFGALSSGSAPWFADLLRRPEEIGDFSDKGRRKMPAMMRGADGRMLTLTRRQINMIIRAASSGIFRGVDEKEPSA